MDYLSCFLQEKNAFIGANIYPPTLPLCCNAICECGKIALVRTCPLTFQLIINLCLLSSIFALCSPRTQTQSGRYVCLATAARRRKMQHAVEQRALHVIWTRGVYCWFWLFTTHMRIDPAPLRRVSISSSRTLAVRFGYVSTLAWYVKWRIWNHYYIHKLRVCSFLNTFFIDIF